MRVRFPHAVGSRWPHRQGTATLRERAAIEILIASEEFPAKPGELKKPPGFVLSGTGNETKKNGADDERDILDARMAAAAAGEAVEDEEPAARVRAVRRASAARHAGADRECARALRAGRAPRIARVVDAVTGDFAGCARPA